MSDFMVRYPHSVVHFWLDLKPDSNSATLYECDSGNSSMWLPFNFHHSQVLAFIDWHGAPPRLVLVLRSRSKRYFNRARIICLLACVFCLNQVDFSPMNIKLSSTQHHSIYGCLLVSFTSTDGKQMAARANIRLVRRSPNRERSPIVQDKSRNTRGDRNVGQTQ